MSPLANPSYFRTSNWIFSSISLMSARTLPPPLSTQGNDGSAPTPKTSKVAPEPKIGSNGHAQPPRTPLLVTTPTSPKKRNSISTPKSSNNSNNHCSRRPSIAGSDTSSRPSSGSEIEYDVPASPTSEARRHALAQNPFLRDACKENGISPDQFVRSCHRTLSVEIFASKIDSIEGVGFFTSLVSLCVMRQPEVTDLELSLTELFSLESLWVTDCGLKTLSRGTFSSNTNLQTLHLSGNKVRSCYLRSDVLISLDLQVYTGTTFSSYFT